MSLVLSLYLFPYAKIGSPVLTATTQSVGNKPVGESSQLLEAVVGSVAVTCVTIMLALLALFFIRKTLLNRRRTFTYQSGSVRMRYYLLIRILENCIIFSVCANFRIFLSTG